MDANSIDTGYYIEQYFYAHNVRFIAVTDQFDTADPGNLHGGIMLPLKNMINEAYSLDIGRKIKAQARQAMKDGDYIGARAPYGYRKDPDNCHKLLIDENTAPVVKQIFEWAYERVALNRIVRNLNEMGIAAPSHYKKSTGEITSPGLIGSGKWQTRTVMKILESEVYTGDLVQGKTKMVDHQQVKADDDNLIIARRTHEPIISHELFTAVQEYRKQVCEESRAVPKRPYTPNISRVRYSAPTVAGASTGNGRNVKRPGYLLVPLPHEQPCGERYLQRRDDAGDRADCNRHHYFRKRAVRCFGYVPSSLSVGGKAETEKRRAEIPNVCQTAGNRETAAFNPGAV